MNSFLKGLSVGFMCAIILNSGFIVSALHSINDSLEVIAKNMEK